MNTRSSRANRVRLIFVVVSCGILTIGCRAKPRAYDPPPERHLLEDRWSGYYFDQVHAEFFVPLYSPSPQLYRDFSEPIEVVSATGERRATLSSPAATAPNGALVTIDYSTSEEGVGDGQVTVELRWPRNDGPVAVGQSYESETRSAGFSFKQLRWFLKRSGRFEVDGDDPYYRLTQKGVDLNSTEKKHRIDVEIKGRGRDGDLKRRLGYEKPTELYKIVDEVWPGAG